jgi:hypothetical protein
LNAPNHFNNPAYQNGIGCNLVAIAGVKEAYPRGDPKRALRARAEAWCPAASLNAFPPPRSRNNPPTP